MEYLSHSERETEEIGAELAQTLRPGSVIAFQGGLGMGKTAFIRGLARGLGYPGRVTSPTFTIVNEYEGGRLPLFHFDLYRLGGAGELWDLGWDEYQERGGICAAEWSERAEALFPDGTLFVTLERGSDGDSSRRITITGADGALSRLCADSGDDRKGGASA
ncbi:MAG: tRNA (adenosine(37)-N6)-threonylcarbamoyltransferase complex ATPase subunit type 1 TsaE [Oscillospiraceae bacterium]|nr:tRNA (adenosine(37)-N6)-threonylcarbamoyltransferase complex ATPase subunit type 1 TsaE [Oscillospiraceae bacterium]